MDVLLLMSLVCDWLTDWLGFDCELPLSRLDEPLALLLEPPSLRAMAEFMSLDWAAYI